MTLRIAALLLVLGASAFAQAPKAIPVQWNWFVVSTPDIVGPFRGNDPGFKPPTPRESLPRTLKVAEKGKLSGVFEVIVTTKGTAELEAVLASSGPAVRVAAKAVFRRWRLEPASLDGTRIRVRLRVSLQGP